MSHAPPEIHGLSRNLTIWHRYSPQLKVELFSTPLRSDAGLYLIDSTHLDPESLEEIVRGSTVAGVIAPSGHHQRDSALYVRQFSVPFYATREANLPEALPICEGQTLEGDLRVIAIEGAASGECALQCDHDGGTLKYCSNQYRMRKSLRKLLEHDFERMLFAHGPPLVSSAREGLCALLQEKA